MRRITVLFGLALILLVAAACSLGPQPTPVPPTKTPKPTFTPTANVPPTPLPLPTATRVLASPTAVPPTATPQPTAAPPTATPTPVPAPRFTTIQGVNVRSGPGTNYGILGELPAGQSFDITGKNPAGNWYQFNYGGRSGWVFSELVAVSGNTGAIPVAQNIPTAPPPTATPRPQPTAPPQPVATATRRYEYNIALVQRCDPQEAGTWFRGTVYKNGQPINDIRVVFSWVRDGQWVTNPVTTGPHPGYPNWNPGFYEHIISAPVNGPVAGTWFVWLVDSNGNRISEIASWTSSGKVPRGEGCNEAVVDFDSR